VQGFLMGRIASLAMVRKGNSGWNFDWNQERGTEVLGRMWHAMTCVSLETPATVSVRNNISNGGWGLAARSHSSARRAKIATDRLQDPLLRCYGNCGRSY
jgi:hypothetical protein